MYRQATQLVNTRVSFICDSRENENDFPAYDCEVISIPNYQRKSRPGIYSRAISLWLRAKNRDSGYFNGTRPEICWWRDQLDRINPDTILFQYGTSATKYASLVASMGYPYFIHFHGYDLSRMLRSWLYRKQITHISNHAAGLVVVADYMRKWLTEQGVPESKIHLIPYGAPTTEFSPNSVDPRSEIEECVFLMVGRLTDKKAPQKSILAFEHCFRLNKNCRLRILGSGELYADCKSLVHELGIEDVVTFLGPQPSATVRNELMHASVFIQHSVTSSSGDKEGWPVSIAEAAASGLPIVSTEHAGIPQQVIHGTSGFLCDEGDWRTMASYMAKLSSDKSLRRSFGMAAREHIAQWDTKKQLSRLSDVLSKGSFASDSHAGNTAN